ncbi:MAG: penicillin-binding protein [Rickettsiales bacterium]|nr:penicillin-binding protein [Rickettsiales bacterium]
MKRKNNFFLTLCKWIFVLSIWITLLLGTTTIWAFINLPETESIKITRQPSITFLDREGRILASYGDIYGQSIKYEQLPAHLIDAVIVTEDRRFFNHFGIDYKGILRALIENIRAKKVVQGGSTITQQLAKNLFLTPERSLTRKIHEAILSIWLEFRFTKEQILSIYLNRVYLGSGTYGVQAASEKYFNKKVEELNLYESALIASLLKAPSKYNPISNAKLSDERTKKVLINMYKNKFIDLDDLENTRERNSYKSEFLEPPKSTRYFIDWLLPRVRSYMGEIEEDLIVRTTLDLELQRLAEESLQNVSKKYKSANQSAIVVLDFNGGILSMIGGKDYGDSQFNRVSQAQRQPGSAFKLFVYLSALENGFDPDDKVFDTEISIGDWSPKNYKKEYLGEITVSEAFEKSINTVAVKVSEKIGREKVIDKAKSLGISSELVNSPSVALGTSEVNLLELTGAYNIIANGGNGVWTHGVRYIQNKEGDLLYSRKGQGHGKIISNQTTKDITLMLKRTVDKGTGKNAKIERPVAGKTGTSQSLRDAWFVGFSSHMVAGVWFGNDDDSPMNNITGGTAPATLWREFMQRAHQDLPIKKLSNLEYKSNKINEPYKIKKKAKEENVFKKIIENLIQKD